MRRGALLLLMVLSCLCSAQAQTAADFNEGLQVAPGTTAGDYVLTWWGRAGRTYSGRFSISD